MPIKVLIVEDEAIIAADIESILSNLGYQVVGIAKNGDRALDLFSSLRPDIALLDINIKGSLNGIDLAKIIREKFGFPFIFLTSYADAETLTAAGSTMPYGYIVKPFTDKDLKSNIEIALARFNTEKNQLSFCTDLLEERIDFSLSERDKQVLSSLIDGLTYKEIAAKYFISVNTVKTYQKRVFVYFDVKSRHELVDTCRKIIAG